MAEYIDREKLKQAIAEDALIALSDWDSSLMDLIMLEIEEIPAADVAPVKHGRWIEKMTPYGSRYFECSSCGAHENIHTAIKGRYCWGCGAKMDGGADNATD